MKNTQKRKLPPDPDKMNNQRANAAGRVLEYFADDFGESWKNKSAMVRKQLRSQNLGDLLTDFAHLCDREGFNMAVHFAAARHRYDEETGGKGTQFAPPAPTTEKPKVWIEVTGGVADVTEAPPDVDVHIIDWDNIKQGREEVEKYTEEEQAYIVDAQRQNSVWCAALAAETGLLPHDPQDDEPEEEDEDENPDTFEGDIRELVCNEPGCTTLVNHEDPYYSSPCGTFCSHHMREHVKDCEICRNEFEELDG